MIELSLAQRAFANALMEMNVEFGEITQTNKDGAFGQCLREFGKLVCELENERLNVIDKAKYHCLEPLERLRCEEIARVLYEEKRIYEKESAKYYQNLEKHLRLSTIKNSDFREADAQMERQRQCFWNSSLQYVTAIQSLQEKMKFEFVETLTTFLYDWLNFYHVGKFHTHYSFRDPSW
ncbi:unnamed protein product [Strongylus vulgaris]|uniref:BAR domain-containing protein n=1 Tax=Strongylus vulgaris TaxID=40348 RepID=A0A3P7J2X3_STRVU|nr:unnamed protein product [Strongylus vulgaris]